MHRRAIKGDASVAAAAAAAASRALRSICDPDLTPLALELELPKSRQSSPVNNDRRKLPGRRKIPRRVRTLSETDDAAALAAIGSTGDLRRAPSRRSFLSRDYFDARKLRRRERDDEDAPRRTAPRRFDTLGIRGSLDRSILHNIDN